jgi:hypothetical protein
MSHGPEKDFSLELSRAKSYVDHVNQLIGDDYGSRKNEVGDIVFTVDEINLMGWMLFDAGLGLDIIQKGLYGG